MTRSVFISVVLAFLTASVILSCNKQAYRNTHTEQVDSLINIAYKSHDYDSLIVLAEEFQASGELSDMKACYWRGYAYSRQRKMRLAENDWQRAVSLNVKTAEDMEYYAKSATRLAGSLLLKGEYEQTMKVAMAAMEKMKDAGLDQSADYAYLLVTIGCCQLKLENPKDAASNFEKAYQDYCVLITQKPVIAHFNSAIVSIINITDNYLLQKRYTEAYYWTIHFEEMLNEYRLLQEAEQAFLDKQQARLNFYRASALEGLGQHNEAANAYIEAMKTKYAATNEGRLEAISYLMSAKRWNEAAVNFEVFDEQAGKYGVNLSLDIIQHYLSLKFRANVGAQKLDSAIYVANQICNALDTAIVQMQQDEAVELTTMYSIQQKETEFMRQRAELSRQRYWAVIIALTIFLLFTAHLFFFRHKAAKRLEKAYSQLEVANERIRESSRMKTSFIRQISHEIRTPLNVLTGFTQVICTPDITLDEETKADINRKIMENTMRITELVNKMLELSDVSSKTVIERNDTVPAIQIAAEAISSFPMDERYKIPVELNLSNEVNDIQITTNEQAATRAITLLLDNAEKYTKEGTIRLLVDLNRDKNVVCYTVEDTGIGVPASEAEHIFEKFVQLNENNEGTGIGLTVARSLVRRMGGDIVLDTLYPNGARFVMTLPL